jgi:hypothetical protein
MQIKKKKSANPFSANKVPVSEVSKSASFSAGEFAAKANIKALKKASPMESVKEIRSNGFNGSADSVPEEKIESANSAYKERIKKRMK